MSSIPSDHCLFAVPKKGRLYEKVTDMLRGAGVEYHREPRLDIAICKDLPMTMVFLPASDIPKYVGEGNVDIGVTGIDIVEENGLEVERVMDLGFGKCRLCVQAPVAKGITDVKELAGSRIVTSFPELTKKFFDPLDKERGVKTSVKFVSGSVEAACGLGLADAVVDLVETGTTMKAAGLGVVETILNTEAILITNPNSSHRSIVNLLKHRIEGYITSKKFVMVSYNCSSDILELVCKITPGKRSPTITSLTDGGHAVSGLVKKGEVVKVMDELHAAGARDILVFEMANSRM
ncbi:ATP phosphoribosyltransferase [Thalassiosira pseudonana CCMP1335]|uniref:ATP phosphoribosyltransferase n=1 Tax=Thalassiosira pseudonana TaxID=35128 RepID=B8C4E1_THAPS|nr:ATP phosphoribosyltransferase [Thalassiosira pseudonana CCMP1335]EED91706.1 ATP phosphoribosyltransferase [Thalassiosira pseudonana CCMP1335]|eukprot:scaffold2061_cov195-Alexandrium_tamarense.AAC.7